MRFISPFLAFLSVVWLAQASTGTMAQMLDVSDELLAPPYGDFLDSNDGETLGFNGDVKIGNNPEKNKEVIGNKGLDLNGDVTPSHHSGTIELGKLDKDLPKDIDQEPLLPSRVHIVPKNNNIQDLPIVPMEIDRKRDHDQDLSLVHEESDRKLSTIDCATECSSYSRPTIQVSGEEFQTLISNCISGTNCPYSNVPLNCWNTSAVTDMANAFYRMNVQEPLHCWDTAKVTNMHQTFHYAIFNQPIGSWNTGNVESMISMFSHSYGFNQPIDNWNVSKVTSMFAMIAHNHEFNHPLTSWDTTNVTNMRWLFVKTRSFNQPLDNWNVSKVTNMYAMFYAATKFNQCLGTWPSKVRSTENIHDMFFGSQCPLGGTPSLDDSTWCQDASNGCYRLLPATTPFTNWTVVSAENKAAKGVSVEPFSVKTFIETKGDNLSYKIFTGHKPGKPCDFLATPMVEDYSATIVLLEALSDREIYSVQWSIPKVMETPAYNSTTQNVSFCARIGKTADYDSSLPGTDFVSFVDTEVSVQLDPTASNFAQNVTVVPTGNDDYKDTFQRFIDVESLICAPGRQAVSSYQIGTEFGVCVRPTQKSITEGYSVKGFTKVVCSNAASNRTLFNNSIPDTLTSLIDASEAGDISGNKVGSKAAGFVSFVTARYFGNGETSFSCTGEVTLDYQRRRLLQPFTLSGNDISAKRLLQEGSNTSPFSSTIVLATKTGVKLSAGASLVGGVGAVLLSVVVAMM